MKCSGHDVITRERIEIEFDSVISHVDPHLEDGDRDIFVAPGFIDLQVNGFAGADYNSPDTPRDQLIRSIGTMHSTGVTRFFPTVITGSPESMLGALRNLAAARESSDECKTMEAFHVEGPHISATEGPRGAHPARWVRPPDFDEYRRWQDAALGHVRLVTLSPEWPHAPRYIERLSQEGVVTSIGHTGASSQQIQDAVSAGATLSTHLGNGAHSTLPKAPNYLWDQLSEDRLAASFITDGIHLVDAFLKVALRSKGIERSLLVTDAVMPAMCPPGEYKLGEIEVELKEDQSVVLRGGTRLAGSSLRMDRGIENVMRVCNLSLIEAITMATVNPARVGRISSRQRGLRTGERADLVRFRSVDGRIEILETFVSGRRVYSSPGA